MSRAEQLKFRWCMAGNLGADRTAFGLPLGEAAVEHRDGIVADPAQ